MTAHQGADNISSVRLTLPAISRCALRSAVDAGNGSRENLMDDTFAANPKDLELLTPQSDQGRNRLFPCTGHFGKSGTIQNAIVHQLDMRPDQHNEKERSMS